MEKECAVRFCNSTQLVFSGIDAFILGGIPTELICYTCANSYAQKSIVYEQVKDAINIHTLSKKG